MTSYCEETKGGHILVVDDNEANVALLEAILMSSGFTRVMSTTDPRKVLPLNAEHDFDLILLDIRMPHMDGIQVLEALHPNGRCDYVPVIVLTAQTDRETRLRALTAGAQDFITKPFDSTEVVRRVENVMTASLLLKNRARQAEILEEAVRERTHQLEESRLLIIRSLGRAGEFRDNETGRHIMRMSRACKLVALAAGMGEEWSRMLLDASPMHDVGKIGIPDSILLKPGRLTPEEMTIMRRHAEFGASIIPECATPLLTMARTVAITHHEKWDGTGYPRGLKGEEIPVEGRITALCDVFDALTSARPYKKAWPVAEAVAFIKENAGSHFDPKLVEAFLTVLAEIVEVSHQLADHVEAEVVA